MPVPQKTTERFKSALEGKPEVIKGARHIRKLIKYVASALGIGFGWLNLSGADFRPVAADITAELVFHTTMALYVICWVRGLTADTNQQELAYVATPNKFHTYKGSWIVAISLLLAFALLCLTYTTTRFAYSLLIFHTVSIAAWIYLCKFAMRGEFLKSTQIYRDNGQFFQLEELRVVYETYLDGFWQVKRFAVGALVVFAALALRHATQSGQVNIQFRGYSIGTELAIALLFLLYVAIMELWIWRERIRMSAQLGLISKLRTTYTLVRPSYGPLATTVGVHRASGNLQPKE